MSSHNISNKRIIFDHLPKTAGLAIHRWLINNLGNELVSPHCRGEHLNLIKKYGETYPIICGHMSFNKKGFDNRYQYATLLRHPIDRVVSWLHFVVGNDKDPALLPVVQRFINSDGQDVDKKLTAGHISNLYIKHFCCIEGGNKDGGAEKLTNALEAIKKYHVIGLYENMPQFLAELATLVGLPPPESIPRVNVTTSRPPVEQISSTLRKRIEELNELDLKFYETVLAWNAKAIVDGK